MGFDSILWLLAIIAFGIAEAATTALVSVWFVAGSAAALVTSFLTDNFWIQFLVFAVVSALSLGLMVPTLAKRRAEHRAPVTNGAPLTIGKRGHVLQEIKPGEVGRVHVDGLDWQACAQERLKKGDDVQVVNVEGATLWVEPVCATTQNS